MKASRNFHIPLSEELYTELRAEAQRSQRPATELARQALELWLSQQRKNALRQSIAAYAAQHAGSDVDLDLELEQAAVDHLLSPQSGS